ncbi:MAG: VTT domain-containing protein [Candidatus Bathyarchaeia archaeon]|jgi:membrane protein YqaA with SNARE-associated domain
MLPLIEFIIVFLVSVGFNLIPFAGPSNLFIASTAALALGNTDPASLIIVGILVALGATLAKGSHYGVTFFIGKHLNEKRRVKLDADAEKIKKWAFILLYVAAASPIPDEPIVIPLGLMKYSITKFFTAYFLGKLTIAIPGAFLAGAIANRFSGEISINVMVVASIILTIVVTIILLKVDLGELAKRFMRKKTPQTISEENVEKIN